MTTLPLEKDTILKRVEGIEGELKELATLSQQSLETFSSGDGWKLAQFHLHRALEGVFNIGTHILSRIPGAQSTQYKEIAQKLGEYRILPKEFADNQLVSMAKYRNRLVHFYAQITKDELYTILQKDLDDFDIFLSAVKHLLSHPELFDLTVE